MGMTDAEAGGYGGHGKDSDGGYGGGNDRDNSEYGSPIDLGEMTVTARRPKGHTNSIGDAGGSGFGQVSSNTEKSNAVDKYLANHFLVGGLKTVSKIAQYFLPGGNPALVGYGLISEAVDPVNRLKSLMTGTPYKAPPTDKESTIKAMQEKFGLSSEDAEAAYEESFKTHKDKTEATMAALAGDGNGSEHSPSLSGVGTEDSATQTIGGNDIANVSAVSTGLLSNATATSGYPRIMSNIYENMNKIRRF